jgi:UDP-N-acetylmuramate dehydrogenase
MMAAEHRPGRLIERLPKVRGRLTENAPLAAITWFRVGGPAEIMFRPADADDLAQFLAGKPDDVPVTVLGVASNLLVRDGGIDGVVIRLGRFFVEIATDGATVRAGAGALDLNVALASREAGIAGLEFLSGIPGTIGGALRMNAGAYGREIKDMLRRAVALDGQGKRHEVDAAALGLAYRQSSSLPSSPAPQATPSRSAGAWPRSRRRARRASRSARAPAARPSPIRRGKRLGN